MHASKCAQRGKWPLDSVGKYVFVFFSVYVHPFWMDVVWVSDRPQQPRLINMGGDEEEGLPQACDKIQANAEHVSERDACVWLQN